MAISWKQLGEDWLVEDPQVALGWRDGDLPADKQNLIDYLQMQLAVSGLPVPLWQRHLKYLTHYCSKTTHADVVKRMDLQQRIQQATDRLEYFNTDAYLQRIEGTLGTDPALQL